MIFYPPLQLYADQLPRVDWLLGEESWEPRVVQESELVEVPPFMCHHAGVDIVKESVGVRHPRHLLSLGVIDLFKFLLAEFLRE